jgi:hypothetical protein
MLVLAPTIAAAPLVGPVASSWTGWSTDDGWGPVGSAPHCWKAGESLLRFDCAERAPCGSPSQQGAYLNRGAMEAGFGLVIAYRGAQLTSEDPNPRWPGVVLRHMGPGDFVGTTPMVNAGAFGVFVTVYQDGRDNGSKWVPAKDPDFRPPSSEVLYEFLGVRDSYEVRIDNMLVAKFTAGPLTGGVSGPGILIGCGAWTNILTWQDYVQVNIPIG